MRGAAALAALLLAGGAPLRAQPVVREVAPPNWWPGHSINPVRLLVRGTGLGGARMQCGRLACGSVRVNAAGTALFVDVTVPAGTAPGAYPLRVTTAAGDATIPFAVHAPLPAAGRFRGLSTDDALYLLMPDRFANGDTTNDRPAGMAALLDRSRGRYYHGGDLAGVRQRLPYLQALGITALWMNPVYDNHDGLNRKETYDGQPITDYHGYGAVDFYRVDEHLGTVAELRALVDEAHRHGIKVVLDMVANHTGPYHPWVQDPPTPTWYHGTAERHLANSWQTWTLANPYAHPALREATLDGWFLDILPDLNQDDPEVARYLIQNTLWWVGMTGIDGIRQDTWPYVPRRFWRDWMAAIKRQYSRLTVVGEVFDGDPAMLAFFDGRTPGADGIATGVDHLFDFPLFYPLREAFAQGKPVKGVAQMLMRDHLLPDPAARVTFLGLHDVARFLHEPGATPDGLRLAFTVLLTTRGIPLVYYGDEVALAGGNDPDNRRDFPGGWPGDPRSAFEPAGRTAAEAQVWDHVQRLLRLRREHAALRRAPTTHLVVTEQQFVYRRGPVVVAVNNDTVPATVRVPEAVAGTDALAACAPPVGDGSGSRLALPARASCVFVAPR